MKYLPLSGNSGPLIHSPHNISNENDCGTIYVKYFVWGIMGEI